MSDSVLVGLAAVVLNTVVVGSTGLVFVVRLGTRLDALAEVLHELAVVVRELRLDQNAIDRRLARLEGKTDVDAG